MMNKKIDTYIRHSMKAWAASIQFPEDKRAQLFGLALSVPKFKQPTPFNSIPDEMVPKNRCEDSEPVKKNSNQLKIPVIEDLETT